MPLSSRIEKDIYLTDDSFEFPPPVGPYDEYDEDSPNEILQATNEREAEPLISSYDGLGTYLNEETHNLHSDSTDQSLKQPRIKWSDRWKSFEKRESKLSSLRPRNKSRNDLASMQAAHEEAEEKQESAEYKKLGNDEKYDESGLARKRNIIMIHLGQWKRHRLISMSNIKQTFQRVWFRYSQKLRMLGQSTAQNYHVLFNKSSPKAKVTSKKTFQFLFLGISIPLFLVMLLASFVVLSFFSDAEKICRTPESHYIHRFAGISNSRNPEDKYRLPLRPLVEYYIHGRGNGHYSRSVAIIKKLNAEGIDVRMFIGRAVMWKEVNAINDMADNDDEGNTDSNNMNNVGMIMDSHKAKKVAQLVLLGNEDNIDQTDASLQHILDTLPWNHERILHLSIGIGNTQPEIRNDIEEPGITTAISVTSLIPKQTILSAISFAVDRINGDCEVSRQTNRYPDLVVVDGDIPGILRAKLGRIPSVSISHGETFSIAEEPNWKDGTRNLGGAWKQQKWMSLPTNLLSDWSIGTNFVPLEVKSENSIIAKPPFRAEIKQMAKVREMRIDRHSNAIDFYGTKAIAKKRNKLVLCYFRDKNGRKVVDILLQSGYDVVEFHSAKVEPGKEIGKQWMLTSEMRKKAQQEMHLSPFNNTVRRELSLSEESRSSNYDEKESKENFDAYAVESSPIAENESQESSRNQEDKQTAHVTDKEALYKLLSSSSDKPRSIKVYDKNLFVAFMGIVDGIVGSGGSQMLSESIYGRIPMLALHRSEDSEQTLNIEMLRRKRNDSIRDLKNSKSAMSEKKIPPSTYGTSIEAFLSIYSNDKDTTELTENSNPNMRKTLEERDLNLQVELAIARKEVKDFFSAIENSIVSQSYYNDLFHILHGVENIDKWGENTETNQSNLESVLSNSWFDEMHDASDILFEILNEIF